MVIIQSNLISIPTQQCSGPVISMLDWNAARLGFVSLAKDILIFHLKNKLKSNVYDGLGGGSNFV